MKIALICLSGLYPINIGGPSSVGYFLAKWLGYMDNEVTVYFRLNKDTKKKYDALYEEYYDIKNVVFKPLFINYNIYSYIIFPLLIYNILKISLDIAKKDYDLIHYNSVPVDIAIFLPIISYIKKINQTMTIHGAIFADKKFHMFRKVIIMQKSFFNRIIVLNDYSKNLALNAGFNISKIIEIPNGIEISLIEKSNRIDLKGFPIILFVGVLTKNKAVDVLIKALEKTVDLYPNILLYIVGDGPEKKQLVQLINDLGIRDHTIFTGFIPTLEVYSYYKSADIVVLPSYKENFSITILEAMASKTLIIVSDAPGNLSIIEPNKNGFVFPRGDSDTLSDLLINSISDKIDVNKLTENAYNKVKENYTWKAVTYEYEKVFRELVNK